MLRPFRITCEVVASLLGIVVAFSLFMFWRLSSGPIYSEFMTPYIEAGIESLVPGTQVTIAHSLLSWNDSDRTITLAADGLRVRQRGGEVIALLPKLEIQLSAVGILFGQFLPTEMGIDGLQIQLERGAHGQLAFGGMEASQSETADQAINIRQSLARISNRLVHAYFTRHLRITHAIFAVHDTVTQSDWAVTIPEIALEREAGALTGHAAVDLTQNDRVSTLTVDYHYDTGAGLHRLISHFSDITPAFFAGGHPGNLGFGKAAIVNLPLTGEISAALDTGLEVVSAALNVQGGRGFFNDSTLWDGPRKVQSLELTGLYDRNRGVLSIPTATVDFGGPRLSLSVKGASRPRPSHQMDIALGVQIDNWAMDQVGGLWPKPFIGGARQWIAANLTKGKFGHGEAAIAALLDLENLSDVTITDAKGKVNVIGAQVRYVDTMSPVEGVSADATFDMNQLTAEIASGGIGDIRIQPFLIQIKGFQDKVQVIHIPVRLNGSISSVLRLIDEPPLGYAKALGLAPDDITGSTEAQVTFQFPLLKKLGMSDVDVKAKATLADVQTSKLVKGIELTHGNLQMSLNIDGFTVTGPATLNRIPLNIAWNESFAASRGQPLRQAAVTGVISPEQWRSLGIDAFQGTHGLMAIDVHMTQPEKARMVFAGKVDMAGAEVRIAPLSWKKSAAAPAALTFSAEKRDHQNFEITTLEATGPQLSIKGKGTLSGEGKLLSLTVNPMIAGHSNAVIHFARLGDDSESALHIDVEGEALDIQGIKGRSEPGTTPPQPIEFRLRLGKLYTSETGFMTKAEGYAIRDPLGWREISLHGLADGTNRLDFELAMREDGSRTLDIICDNFGKALKGMGFTDTIENGTLNIHGESDPENTRSIRGEVKIGLFVVGNLPALAVLMNAASPFGFSGLFTNSMDFDGLKGGFKWEGDTIHLIGVHAAGASVGINTDGHIDVGSGEANLYGTMVPFSVMSSLIGAIPIVGLIVTGIDKQGFLAVSYTIKGPMANPEIMVNPVSLLTPGFLRNLFFSGDDTEEPRSAQNTQTPATIMPSMRNVGASIP
ncbi:MAG: DUF3971 domain-containing protein [Pseudomonadota bacterium]|nr:DUF3971 domain-containing protein [Pseudomonadota bacterium]